MKIIKTDQAPQAIGPYSQAIIVDGLLFTSGQMAIDPATGKMDAVTIEDQTKQVMKNLRALLTAAHTSLEKVIKTTIFLQDMNDFNVVNQIYGEYFSTHQPARSTVQVARLPKDAKIEIELIAKI